MSKKRPKISFKPGEIIDKTNIEDNPTNLVLSYKYLDKTSSKYCFELIDDKMKSQFYDDFLKKMTEYCQYLNFKKEISSNRRYASSNHIHPIDWTDNKIKEKNFNCLDIELMKQIEGDCWQLGINNQGFRIHGFFIENVFYIVWLDPCHKLYERK